MKKEIAQAVKANRRLLGLVDDQIACLAKTTPAVALDAIDADRRMPYWYVATSPTQQQQGVGLSDYTKQNATQSPFIRITQGMTAGTFGNTMQYPDVGYIRVQSDAAFVATNVLTSFSVNRAPEAVQGGTFYPNVSQKVAFRLYDESSNRWISLTNQDRLVQQRATLPGIAISPSSLFYENGSRLPTECVFPRNALIRVEVYYYDVLTPGISSDTNIYFALGGYKVFGG
ncbi:MAG: hypothetical protein EBT03_07355 [Betaproteobacteria bacterium]|nr:hypothetical protein [Betaproteobacteria bacterium]NCA16486.1 hypothetical protein [Betaproteobacteria bacterium]